MPVLQAEAKSTTLQPPNTAVQPPSTTVQPPSTTVPPPSTTVQPPSTDDQPLDTGTESAALKPANTRAHETMDKDDAGTTPASSMTVFAGVNSSIIVLLVCLAIIRSMFRNGSVLSASAIVFVLYCVCLANCALCVYLLLAVVAW